MNTSRVDANGRSHTDWGKCTRCSAPLHQVTIKRVTHPDLGKTFATCMTHGHSHEIVFEPGDEVVHLSNVPNNIWIGLRVQLLYPIPEHTLRPYMWAMKVLHIPANRLERLQEQAGMSEGDTIPSPIGAMGVGYWVARVVPEFSTMQDADQWLEGER